MYTDLFNKISSSCFFKCASRKHRDQDLSLGEMTCTGKIVVVIIVILLWSNGESVCLSKEHIPHGI